MRTLVVVKVGDKVVGRCDARCYMAKHDHCDCCCDGRNHGVGLKKAIEQTQQLDEREIGFNCGMASSDKPVTITKLEIHPVLFG